jgi:hypothetical protein
MRAADATEKVTRSRPELLAPHTQTVLDRVALLPEPEIRWHVAELLPRLPLTSGQRMRAIGLLQEFLENSSRIVQACALQALVELTEADATARKAVLPLVRRLARHGSPAVRARARRLMAGVRVPSGAAAAVDPAPRVPVDDPATRGRRSLRTTAG